jgi:hypothetical protein
MGRSGYWIDGEGILHGPIGEGRPATDAERWFQAERDRYGEFIERVRDHAPDHWGPDGEAILREGS